MKAVPDDWDTLEHTTRQTIPVFGDGYLVGFLTPAEAVAHVKAGKAVWVDAKKNSVNDSQRAIAALRGKPWNKAFGTKR